MAYPLPSLSETRTFLLAVGRAVLPGRNFATLRAYLVRKLTVLSAAVTQLHSHIRQESDDVMADTASDNGPIDRIGGIYKLPRKSATPAFGEAAGRVRGVLATNVDLHEELVHDESGLLFEIAKAAVIPGALYVDCDIQALSNGAATRLLKNATLRFVSTPPGLQTSVTLVRALDQDGLDREQYGAYQSRVLDRIGTPGSGGNDTDYRSWMLQVVDVAQAYVFSNRGMRTGTVDLVGLRLGVGIGRELAPAKVTEMMDYVRSKAPNSPAALPGALRHLDVVADPQPIELVITPDGQAANAFDWSGGPLIVASYTSGTREVTFTTDLPISLAAGQRGSFKPVATAQDGREFRIEAITGTDKLTLETAPDVDPAATDLFYAGGPLVTPIRDALAAHVNGRRVYAGRGRVPLDESAIESTVGLEIISEGIGPANPDGVYGTWIGGLYRSVLSQIAQYKGGVLKVSVSLPAADHDAEDDEFPLDTQIHMVTASYILVRSA